MSTFDELFDEGERNAGLAKSNIEEIEQVFRELNQSFLRKTDGEKNIYKSFGERRNAAAEMRNIGLGMSSWFAPKNFVDEGLAENPNQEGRIIISSKTSQKKKVIALWEMDSNGYPVVIKYRGVKNSCRNKEALEVQLGKIISSTDFWLAVKEIE